MLLPFRALRLGITLGAGPQAEAQRPGAMLALTRAGIVLLLIGAGYLAAIAAGALGVFVARSYASVRALVPGFCALGISLLAATLIDAAAKRAAIAMELAGLEPATSWVRSRSVLGAESWRLRL